MQFLHFFKRRGNFLNHRITETVHIHFMRMLKPRTSNFSTTVLSYNSLPERRCGGNSDNLQMFQLITKLRILKLRTFSFPTTVRSYNSLLERRWCSGLDYWNFHCTVFPADCCTKVRSSEN